MANVVSNDNDNDNDNNDIKVVTIEINKNNGDIAKRNIKDAELSNKIKLITGDAIELILNYITNSIYYF